MSTLIMHLSFSPFLFPLQIPISLPEGKYVKLSKSDQAIIEKWIDNKLGPAAMIGQKNNMTTNISESSHLTVLRGSPKCRNRLRNFRSRAMSAVDSMSLGVIDSVLVANAHLGADNIRDCPASRTRGLLRHRQQYQKGRRKSAEYKITQYASVARSRRMRYGETSNTGYGTGVQNPVARHNYLLPSTSGCA